MPMFRACRAGRDGRELVKLSANENPLGTSPAALEARGTTTAPNRYPDPDSVALREAIGRLHRIDPARIVCGTGSDELLNLAAQAFAGPGDEAIHVRYGFAGLRDRHAPLRGDAGGRAGQGLRHRCRRAARAGAREDPGGLPCQPEQPTGSFLPKAELARLHADCRATSCW